MPRHDWLTHYIAGRPSISQNLEGPNLREGELGPEWTNIPLEERLGFMLRQITLAFLVVFLGANLQLWHQRKITS